MEYLAREQDSCDRGEETNDEKTTADLDRTGIACRLWNPRGWLRPIDGSRGDGVRDSEHHADTDANGDPDADSRGTSRDAHRLRSQQHGPGYGPSERTGSNPLLLRTRARWQGRLHRAMHKRLATCFCKQHGPDGWHRAARPAWRHRPSGQ